MRLRKKDPDLSIELIEARQFTLREVDEILEDLAALLIAAWEKNQRPDATEKKFREDEP